MNQSLTFGSLFAGIGGIDLGFERSGMVCKWQVEIDDYANKVLEKHWPNVRRWQDVRTWPQPDTEPVDVICGGFPCQDISYAGRGAGLEGERSGLFFEAVRVVRQLRPRFVVLENVAALLTRGLERVLGTLAEIGFDAEWHCIPAAAVGAPHIRDRVFILAYAKESGDTNGTKCASRTFVDECGANVADSDNATEKRQRQHSGQILPDEKPTRFGSSGSFSSNANSTRLAKWQREDTSGAGALCRAQPSRDSQWDVEPNVGRVANGVPARVDRLRGLGNAVVPQVAEWIGRQIVQHAQATT